ncbi:MAG: TRAP transporter small permease subunit [Desulfofustis sp.]|nr:TRAP transporter small permease subunit [Desulfofustis sp.]
MFKKTLNTIDTISIFLGKLFSYLILPIMLLEAIEVVLRYGFGTPTDWGWELATHLAGAMFIMGAAWVLLEDKHVRTDLIYGRLSRRWQAALDVFFFTIIFFSFTFVLTFKSWNMAIYSTKIFERTFSMWGPPLFPLKITIAAGFTILLLQGLAKWSRDFHYLVTGREL